MTTKLERARARLGYKRISASDMVKHRSASAEAGSCGGGCGHASAKMDPNNDVLHWVPEVERWFNRNSVHEMIAGMAKHTHDLGKVPPAPTDLGLKSLNRYVYFVTPCGDVWAQDALDVLDGRAPSSEPISGEFDYVVQPEDHPEDHDDGPADYQWIRQDSRRGYTVETTPWEGRHRFRIVDSDGNLVSDGKDFSNREKYRSASVATRAGLDEIDRMLNDGEQPPTRHKWIDAGTRRGYPIQIAGDDKKGWKWRAFTKIGPYGEPSEAIMHESESVFFDSDLAVYEAHQWIQNNTD